MGLCCRGWFVRYCSACDVSCVLSLRVFIWSALSRLWDDAGGVLFYHRAVSEGNADESAGASVDSMGCLSGGYAVWVWEKSERADDGCRRDCSADGRSLFVSNVLLLPRRAAD